MNRRVLTIIVSCLLLALLVLWLFRSPDPAKPHKNDQQSVHTQWATSYGIQSADPRGLGFFNELLRTHVKDSVYILSDWDQLDSIPGKDSATYLFIGEAFGLYDDEFEQINASIDSGATIFYAFDHITQNLYDHYFDESAYYWEYNDHLYIAMGDTSLSYSSVFQNDTVFSNWYTFNPQQIRDSLYKAFAYAMDYPVAYESRQHKGLVVMHSIPQLFMNYQVLQPNGFAHAEVVLRRIPKNKPVIWLEYGRRIISSGNSNSDAEGNDGNDKEDTSLIQFLMQHDALRWAFLYGIIVFLLYALFRARRREPVIPGIPQKRNMSLTFVETLSSIYLSRNSLFSVMLVLRKNFYMAVQRHFYIDLLNTKNRDEDIKRLIEKSSVEGEELRKMLTFMETNKPSQVTAHSLTQLYRYLRKFYRETGIGHSHDMTSRSQETKSLHRSLVFGGVGTLLGLVLLIRGMYSLSMGSGYGILIVLASLVVLFFAIRLFTLPAVRISEKSITVYHLFYGKETLEIDSTLAYSIADGRIAFYTQNGGQISVSQALLSSEGRRALLLFVEHIKHQSA